MKTPLILIAVCYLAEFAYGQECPKSCVCSEGTSSIARCTQLDSEMMFPEVVQHLVVESIPYVQINLTRAFFKNIGLQQLLKLKIANCSISYIDIGTFEGLQDLNDVILSDNGLILIHPDTFVNNTKLEQLALSGNALQLTQVLKGEDYFLKSTSLLELDLSRCQLGEVDKRLLAQMPNLQYINLSDNNIKVIDEYIFENAPLLDEVNLSNNFLISLTDGIFEDIDELEVLNLKNNLIENIDSLDLPGLKELDVSHNNIKLLRKVMFEGISDLSVLNISHNGITWISEETFKDLTELRHLDLSNNALVGPLPKFIFEGNEDLETLSLSGNKDMHIFEGFSTELPRLYSLDLSDCGLVNITNTSFNVMPELAILNISMNSLTTLNHMILAKLHRLNVLDVSYNNITKIGTHTFASNTHLRKLNLSNNKVNHISPDLFGTTPNLSILDISYNHFHHIWHANDSVYMKDNQFLEKLEYLNIAGNQIIELHKNNFLHLTSLKGLNIQGNLLECTTEFPAFIEWLYSNEIQPMGVFGRTAELEKELETTHLQWDDIMMNVCKHRTQNVQMKTEPKKDSTPVDKDNDLNIYHYTVIEDVKLTETKQFEQNYVMSEQNEQIAEEITTYVWPTFMVVFSLVFLTLAVCNIAALLIYRSRNQFNTPGFKTTFVTPFKRTVVKMDTTPRYHKLYEECSVPNTPIVKSNLLGNLVTSQIKNSMLPKSKSDDII